MPINTRDSTEKVKGLLHDSIKKILRQQAKGTHGILYRRYETTAREAGGIYIGIDEEKRSSDFF